MNLTINISLLFLISIDSRQDRKRIIDHVEINNQHQQARLTNLVKFNFSRTTGAHARCSSFSFLPLLWGLEPLASLPFFRRRPRIFVLNKCRLYALWMMVAARSWIYLTSMGLGDGLGLWCSRKYFGSWLLSGSILSQSSKYPCVLECRQLIVGWIFSFSEMVASFSRLLCVWSFIMLLTVQMEGGAVTYCSPSFLLSTHPFVWKRRKFDENVLKVAP